MPIPQPPANLANNCPELPKPPQPLSDPERAIWELEIIAKYGDCALRHRLTIDAWRDAARQNK
jgi:hypothetical protein